jgi:hypothetical protein
MCLLYLSQRQPYHDCQRRLSAFRHHPASTRAARAGAGTRILGPEGARLQIRTSDRRSPRLQFSPPRRTRSWHPCTAACPCPSHSIARKQCSSPGGVPFFNPFPAERTRAITGAIIVAAVLGLVRVQSADARTLLLQFASRNVADSEKRRALDVGRQIILHMSAAPRRQDVIFLLSKNCGDRRAVVGEQDAVKAVRLTCRRLDCEFRSSG